MGGKPAVNTYIPPAEETTAQAAAAAYVPPPSQQSPTAAAGNSNRDGAAMAAGMGYGGTVLTSSQGLVQQGTSGQSRGKALLGI